MSADKFDNRFGMVAIKSGFITKEQLHEVLKIQISEELEGANRRLTGQILLEKDYMTNAQVDEVLISMGLLWPQWSVNKMEKDVNILILLMFI